MTDKKWNLQLRSRGNFIMKNRNILPIISIIITIGLSQSFIDILPENNPESDPISFTDSVTTIVNLVNSESGIDNWEFVETTNVVKSG